jgi:DNA-binding NarL/FixJ family response regulator
MQAVAKVGESHPAVVLMDLQMPVMDGVQATAKIRERYPEVRVLVLTTFDDEGNVFGALRAGAAGYLLKDVSLEALTDAIRAVASGGTMIRPVVTERVLRGLEHVRRDYDSLSPPDALTARELEILRLIAGGYSNREIADALGAAEGTVKNHASSILSKLGVRDRTRAVLTALERGLL